MVKNFMNMKILQVGARVKPFKSIMYNELELAEKFGIDIVSFNLAEAVNDLKMLYETRQNELSAELAKLKETFDCGTCDDETLKKMLCIVMFYEELAKAKNDPEMTHKALGELVGHTPLQVFAGVFVGIGVSLLLSLVL